jgi:hypothetical protein
MLAVIAAICFAIALILDWSAQAGNQYVNHETLLIIGLIMLALHLSGVGTGYNWRRGFRFRR